MLCRHCKRVQSNRPRGLCWSCYYTPGVREKYPSTSKFARRGVCDFNGRPAAKSRLVVLILAFAAVLGAAVLMGADLRQRASLLMLAMALCAAASAWEVTFGASTALRSRSRCLR